VGADHACVIRAGAVECWGNNDSGALGTGDTTDHPFPTPVTLPGPADQVGASIGTTCARVAGAVYCWGANDRGQLGIGSPTADTDGCALPCKLAPIRVEEQIGTLDEAVSLVVGNRNACALRSDGELHCWGSGATSFASPLQLADFGRVSEVVVASICGVSGVDTDMRFLTPDGRVHTASDSIAPGCR
jgi:alpha-tubulin suppressor-like RCC1 family protein